MSTITAPLPHAPRTLGSRLAPVRSHLRRALHQFRRFNEGLDADERSSLCDLTLRPYTEARFHS